MKPAPSLLAQWEAALAFKIGENDEECLSQIPDFRNFPPSFPCNELAVDQYAPYALGCVLACAVLKLYRPWAMTARNPFSLDFMGGWLFEVVPALNEMTTSYAKELQGSLLASLGTVIEMALCAPERLPELVSRIDALDNAALHHMALAAVQGMDEDDDLFSGLYE